MLPTYQLSSLQLYVFKFINLQYLITAILTGAIQVIIDILRKAYTRQYNQRRLASSESI